MIHSRKTTRTLGLLAGLALIGGGVAACSSSPSTDGGSPNADAPVTLTMTVWGSDTDKQVYDKRLALAKQKYPNITVNLQLIGTDYDTKLDTMVAGGKAPDIMELAQEVNVYSSKGQLVDLTPYYKGTDLVSTFGQANVDMYTTDGKLWASPDRAGTEVLYYNKDMFDAAGVAYPTASWTWDDFRNAAMKLTKSSGDKTTQWGYAAGDWWPWYMNWFKQNGGDILDSSGQPVINSPQNVEALQFYNDLVLKDHAAPSPVDYANAGLKNGQPDPLFSQGKLAMDSTGFWDVASFDTASFNWGVAPVPQGVKQATAAFGDGFGVSSASKNKDAAAKVALFLSSAEGEAPIAETGEDVPANLTAVQSDAFTKAAWLKKPIDLSAFADSAKFAYTPPVIAQWTAIQTAFTNGLADVYTGKKSVQDGLNDVQASVQKLLTK